VAAMKRWQMNTDFPLVSHEGVTVRVNELIADNARRHAGTLLLPFRGRW
jgi:hypothetical protein